MLFSLPNRETTTDVFFYPRIDLDLTNGALGEYSVQQIHKISNTLVVLEIARTQISMKDKKKNLEKRNKCYRLDETIRNIDL